MELSINVLTDGKGKLVSKLAEVMAEAKRIPKAGHNDHFNYDYATESDITETIRPALAARKVMVFPSVVSQERREVAGRGCSHTVTSLLVAFTIVDGETGESITIMAVGEGQDDADKGAYKAMTGATKYALLKVFLLATGDDPENNREDESQNQRRQTVRQTSRPNTSPQTAAKPAASATPAAPPANPAPAAQSAAGQPAAQSQRPLPVISLAQKARIIKMAAQKGVSEQNLRVWARHTFGVDLEGLTNYHQGADWVGTYNDACKTIDESDPEAFQHEVQLAAKDIPA